MIIIEDLKDLTWQQAQELIGQDSNKGRIIGITTRPNLRFTPGIYVTTPEGHFKVGEQV